MKSLALSLLMLISTSFAHASHSVRIKCEGFNPNGGIFLSVLNAKGCTASDGQKYDILAGAAGFTLKFVVAEFDMVCTMKRPEPLNLWMGGLKAGAVLANFGPSYAAWYSPYNNTTCGLKGVETGGGFDLSLSVLTISPYAPFMPVAAE